MANSGNELSEIDQTLVNDIRRSIILGKYIEHWGLPKFRTCCRKSEGEDPVAVEVYQFPSRKDGVYRFATVGISGQKTDYGTIAHWEFLLAVPEDLGGASEDKVVHYICDIMAYSLEDGVSVCEGETIPETKLAPEEWSTNAIFFSEALGEPEELSCFHIGAQHVDLIWLVPVTESERLYITDHSLEEFDKKVESAEYSLIDVNRPSII